MPPVASTTAETKRKPSVTRWVIRGLVALSLAGCVPFADPLTDDPMAGGVDMESVVAPAGFEFSTSKAVHAAVRLLQPDGTAAGGVPVALLDGRPDEGGKTLAVGMTSADGTYAADVTVRTDVGRLLRSPAIRATRLRFRSRS